VVIFVEHDEVRARQMIGETALPSIAGLSLDPVNEIDHVVEPAAGAMKTFQTGLAKTVAWYLSNRSWWEAVLEGHPGLVERGQWSGRHPFAD
jgi:hypothetical protein